MIDCPVRMGEWWIVERKKEGHTQDVTDAKRRNEPSTDPTHKLRKDEDGETLETRFEHPHVSMYVCM